jgi:uncharacterized DUF497 family protein
MENQKLGTKDLMEVANCFMDLAIDLAKIFKDGVQIYDAQTVLALMNNPETQAKIKAAYEGRENVAAEVKDLDAMEIFSMVPVITMKAGELVSAISKK